MNGDTPRWNSNDRRAWLDGLAIGLAAIAVFAMTAPRNHSEAEDAFQYAWDVEHQSAGALLHSRHLIYGPVAKALYSAASGIGLVARAYPVMQWFSMLCGGLAATYLFLLFRNRLALCTRNALLGTVLICGSYGMWRYSCEAEIYVPAAAATLAALYAATSPRAAGTMLLAPLLGSLAVLIHSVAVVPVFAAIPVLHLANRRLRHALAHLAVAGLVVAAAYAGCGKSPLSADRVVGPENRLGAALVKGTIAFGQTLVSGNFLFAFPSFGRAVQEAYPDRMLAEERFMGERGGHRIALQGSFTLALLAAVCIAIAVAIARGSRCDPAPAHNGLLPAALVWVLLHAALVLWYEPANPEMWINAVPAFWIAVILLLRRQAIPRRDFFFTIGVYALLFHNAVGGMHPVQSAAGDYNAAKSRWFVEHTKPGDLVLTADNPVFVRYLRYVVPATVANMIQDGVPKAQRQIMETHAPARIYATGDIFRTSPPVRARSPDASSEVEILGRRLAPHFRRVDSSFDGVYVLANP